MMRSVRFAPAVCVFCVALAWACRGVTTAYLYPDDLTHPDYIKRTKAVREFAARRDRSRLPAAFDLLLDDEGQIRAIAHETLRAMTPGGKDFGYRPYLPPETRRAIVARWKAWWIQQARTGEVEGG